MKKIIYCSSILLILSSCNISSTTSSSSLSNSDITLNFYSDNYYLLKDINADKENIFILIYSSTCTHCIEVEKSLANVYNNNFSNIPLVTIKPSDTSKYTLPLEYKDAVDFYYQQGSEYVSPEFLPDYLYRFENYPTPTLMYLKENRELNHIIFGLENNEELLKDSFQSLIE